MIVTSAQILPIIYRMSLTQEHILAFVILVAVLSSSSKLLCSESD